MIYIHTVAFIVASVAYESVFAAGLGAASIRMCKTCAEQLHATQKAGLRLDVSPARLEGKVSALSDDSHRCDDMEVKVKP